MPEGAVSPSEGAAQSSLRHDAWPVFLAVIVTYVAVIYGFPIVSFVGGTALTYPNEAGAALGVTLLWMSIFAVILSPAIPLIWLLAFVARAIFRRSARRRLDGAEVPRLRIGAPGMCRYWVGLSAAVCGYGCLIAVHIGLAPDDPGDVPILRTWWFGAIVVSVLLAAGLVALLRARSRRVILRAWVPIVIGSFLAPAIIAWILLRVA